MGTRDAATHEHTIEEVAKVYLLWDNNTGAWRLDPNCDPQWGQLDGYESGSGGQNCECPDAVEHERVQERAERAPLPSLDELGVLIAQRVAALAAGGGD